MPGLSPWWSWVLDDRGVRHRLPRDDPGRHQFSGVPHEAAAYFNRLRFRLTSVRYAVLVTCVLAIPVAIGGLATWLGPSPGVPNPLLVVLFLGMFLAISKWVFLGWPRFWRSLCRDLLRETALQEGVCLLCLAEVGTEVHHDGCIACAGCGAAWRVDDGLNHEPNP